MFTLLLHNPNTSIYMSLRAAQNHKAARRDTTFIDTLLNPTRGSDVNDAAL
jgi:hypothetical protein